MTMRNYGSDFSNRWERAHRSWADWFDKHVENLNILNNSTVNTKHYKNYIVIQVPGYSKENIDVVFDENTRKLSVSAEQKHPITNGEMKFEYEETLTCKCVNDVKLVNGELIIELAVDENKTQTKLEIN